MVYLDFYENPNYASAFKDSLEVDNIIMMLSALLGNKAIFEAGRTVLVLDEIQACPEARSRVSSGGKEDPDYLNRKVCEALNKEFLRARLGGKYMTEAGCRDTYFRISGIDVNFESNTETGV